MPSFGGVIWPIVTKREDVVLPPDVNAAAGNGWCRQAVLAAKLLEISLNVGPA